MQDEQSQKNLLKKVVKRSIQVILAILLLIIILGSYSLVGAGEKGVRLRLGAVVGQVDEGLNFKTPFIEKIVKIDVKIQKEEQGADAASKDLQNIHANIALNYHLDTGKVADLYKNIGIDFKSRIIDPAIQESLKSVTAKYTAEELITKRPEVKEGVKLTLSERLKREFIYVDEVSITNFSFSPSFNQAIETKVTAEQNALAAKNKLEQVKYEADQRIAQAKAEAEAIKLQSDAANNEKYVSLKALDVQLKAIEKWNGILPTQMIPSSSVPFINLTK